MRRARDAGGSSSAYATPNGFKRRLQAAQEALTDGKSGCSYHLARCVRKCWMSAVERTKVEWSRDR